MDTPLLQVALFIAIPALTAIIGGIVATFWRPGPKIGSYVQHLAAGVVLCAAATELLPRVMNRSPWVAVVGFALGIAAMLSLQWVTRRMEEEGEAGRKAADEGSRWWARSSGLVFATALDLAVDGLVLGAGFAAGAREGLLLAIALTLELLFLGLSSVSSLLEAGAPRLAASAVTTGFAFALVAFALVGVLMLGVVPPVVVDTVFAFGLVALMYLVVEELLMEAHEVPETPLATAAFFVGFLVYLLILEFVG